MTEQQPPQDRPEFQPPGGDPDGQPVPPPQSPGPAVPAVGAAGHPGGAARTSAAAVPALAAVPTASAAGQLPAVPAARRLPAVRTAPPDQGGRGSIWLGIGITVAVVLVSLGLTTAVPYDSSLYSVTSLLAAVLPFALVLGGIVMAAIPRTTRTGAGILIGIGAGILIAGGLCFALVLGLGSGG